VDSAPVEGEEVEEIDVGFVNQGGCVFSELALSYWVRLSSWWLASSTMAQAGRKVCRSRRGCSLAAASRRRCLAQLMQLAMSAIVLEPMAETAFLKMPGESFVTAATMGGGVLEVLENLPEKFLHHVAVAGLVGVGESVFRGRRGTSDGCKLGE
jgi:hypothetical protein